MIDIAWSHFTPWSALAGGILIGLAAASFLLLNGRIAGISGILGGLLSPSRGDIAWRIAFLVGLIGAPAVWWLGGEWPAIRIEAGYPALIIARPAGRAGHPLCVRLHQRPRRLRLVPAVSTFAGCHTELHGRRLHHRLYPSSRAWSLVTMKYSIASLFAGLLFGLGLIVSGMANPEKVLGFLDIAGLWDPSLAFVMGGAIIVGIVAFTVARRRTLSFLGFNMKVPSHNHIDKRLVLGSLVFGVGWGIAGFCPGPGLVALGAGEAKAAVFVASMVAGMAIFEIIERNRAKS